MKEFSGGDTSYYALGRVFQDGKEIEFEWYIGMPGLGEYKYPPMKLEDEISK